MTSDPTLKSSEPAMLKFIIEIGQAKVYCTADDLRRLKRELDGLCRIIHSAPPVTVTGVGYSKVDPYSIVQMGGGGCG